MLGVYIAWCWETLWFVYSISTEMANICDTSRIFLCSFVKYNRVSFLLYVNETSWRINVFQILALREESVGHQWIGLTKGPWYKALCAFCCKSKQAVGQTVDRLFCFHCCQESYTNLGVLSGVDDLNILNVFLQVRWHYWKWIPIWQVRAVFQM